MLDNNALTLLAYTSVASHAMTHGELFNLLEHARENNHDRNVTGMLLYMDGCFFQVLEGERLVVDRLYEKISQDSRHHNVLKIIEEPLDVRGFNAWTMGYQHVTREEMTRMTGLTDFLDREDAGFETMESTRARKLIEYFRAGRWQNKLVGRHQAVHAL